MPREMPMLIPHLVVSPAAEVIEFYKVAPEEMKSRKAKMFAGKK